VRSSVISTSEELHEGGELLETKSLDSLLDDLRVRTTLNPAPTGLWPISRIFRGEAPRDVTIVLLHVLGPDFRDNPSRES
jgi:hypothetical protein